MSSDQIAYFHFRFNNSFNIFESISLLQGRRKVWKSGGHIVLHWVGIMCPPLVEVGLTDPTKSPRPPTCDGPVLHPNSLILGHFLERQNPHQRPVFLSPYPCRKAEMHATHVSEFSLL